MKMSKLSNQTNSQDPQAVNSRVFVGNLNTFQCSKTDVERMFQRYGRLAGISMHKGYAFVQFTNPFDARNACLGEDGRNILSQTLDVNMVAEPKEHQVGRKRQNVNKTGNDWEYYYDSYYTSTLFPSNGPRPMKRPRMQQQQVLAPTGRLINGIPNQPNGHQQQQQQQQQQQSLSPLHNGHHHHPSAAHGHINGSSSGLMGDDGHPYLMAAFFQNGSGGVSPLNGHPHHQPPPPPPATPSNPLPSLSFKVYSNPDVLICGNCRECFSEITELLDHKRTYCKLRFACKCQQSQNGGGVAAPATPSTTVAVAGASAPSVVTGGVGGGTAAAAAAEPSSLSTKIPSSSVATEAAAAAAAATNSASATSSSSSSRLLCVACKAAFQSPWDLMVHVQAAHMINIYELGATAAAAMATQSIQSTAENKSTGKELNGEGEKTTSSNEVPSPADQQSPVRNGCETNGHSESISKEDQHDTRFSVATPPENGSAAEETLRVEGHRNTNSGNKNNASSLTSRPPSSATAGSLLDDELVQLYDLENASSSSPISQIEIETGDTGNKLTNDNALLAFTTCPAVNAATATAVVVPSTNATPNVAVLGALSIVRSL